MSNSIPLERLPTARSSMSLVEQAMERIRNRYSSGKILTEDLRNFQNMIRFGQNIIGRNVQTRFIRFGHWPKRKKKKSCFRPLAETYKNKYTFRPVVRFRPFFFRPKNCFKFVRLNWHWPKRI